MKFLLAFLLLLTPSFALDRVIVKDNRGRTIGGIVSSGNKSVYVDRKGNVTAVSIRRGRTVVVKTFNSR